MSESASNAVVTSQFLNRVTGLPIVHSALGLANDSYNRIKSYNELIGSTLTRAEHSVQYFAEAAKPVIVSLEKPNTIACNGLDRLTQAVPAITQKPEEVYEAGIQKYEELKKLGTDKIQGFKDYGYNKVNEALSTPYAQAVAKSVDAAVDLTENALNRYFPASEEEQQAEAASGEKNENVVQRVSSLSEKMRRRMYKQAMLQIQVIQLRSQEALNRMKFSVDLIQYAKTLEETGRKKLNDSVQNVQNQAKWLWTELNKEEEANAEPPSFLDQQVLAVARRATKQVVRRYNELISLNEKLPENARKAMEESVNYAKDVYSQLSKANSLKDVSSIAVQQLQAGAVMLQKVLSNAVAPVTAQLNTTPANEEKKEN
ncbi:perilipin-2-like protein [Dinothrombium tinctorium]|uniref:Perilipin-2-like protein n=1 Tax=Dinothrombium tinctorium TaxID=1965070 RepID=A0A3S3PJE1_9ACAR|nr:perilipin-2-like protein [Dinothrombium tinctorium]